jgi:hypothetical protein
MSILALVLNQPPVHVLGGIVISVLATGSNVREFKPGRGRRFLMTIKIRSTTSFGGEVKPSVTLHKIGHIL